MKLLNDVLELVPVDDVRPHPENPRKGDTEFIQGLVEENGFFGALVVQRSTGYILVGNHRWQAAKRAGAEKVPVLYVDVDDERALRILLSDNRANDRAGYDEAALAAMLEGMDELEGTGYDFDALDDLLAGLGQVAETNPEDFQGGYADELGQDRFTAGGPADGRAGARGPMKEVLLYLQPEQHERFMAAVKVLQQQQGTSGVMQTVYAAVVAAAGMEPDSE